MSEHPDITAAREVLQAALDALADAEAAGNPDDIVMFNQAVSAAQRQLDAKIRQHG